MALDPPRCETHDLKDIIEHCPQHSLVESDSSDSAASVINASCDLTEDPLAVDKMREPRTYYDQGNRAVYVVEEPAEPHADDDVMEILAGLEADLSELVMASEINRSAAESRINRAHEEVKKMKSAVVALDEEFSRIKIKLEKAVDSAR